MIFVFKSVVCCLKIHTGFDCLVTDLTNLLLITVFSDLREENFSAASCHSSLDRLVCQSQWQAPPPLSRLVEEVSGFFPAAQCMLCCMIDQMHCGSSPGRPGGCGMSAKWVWLILTAAVDFPPISVVVYFNYCFILHILSTFVF